MKKFTLVFFASFLFVYGKAQYVTIPDTAFVQYLQQLYPNCMNGNQMDTTCPDIIQEQSIYLPPFNFSDAYGIQFFDSVSFVFFDLMDSLRTIPAFPPRLNWLMIWHSPVLDSLPPLPSSLTTLSIIVSDIRNPPVIPPGVTSLQFDQSPLNNAPNFPAGLLSLNLNGDSLLYIPPLPPQLTTLSIQHNQLSSLPAIPASLTLLRFDFNRLNTLPALPNMLRELTFSNNLISSIDSFPDSLQVLNCRNNLITCFPLLPDFPGFNGAVSGNQNACLPNYTSWMLPFDPLALSIPLCSPANPSGCPVSPGISGRVYNEIITNCVADSSEPLLYNIPFCLYDSAGVLLEQTGSMNSGSFMFTPDTGSYEIRLDTSSFALASALCPSGISRSVTLSTSSPSASVLDYDLHCLNGYDPGIQSIVYSGLVFPGQQHTVICSAGDLLKQYQLNCSSGESGQIVLVVSGPVAFQGHVPGFPVPLISGDSLIYTVTDFGSFSPLQYIAFNLETDTLAQIGDTVCIQATVTGTGNDLTPSNNTLNFCYGVSNSYDPNKKDVFPSFVSPGYSDWFTYTIHFQNNGNAPAINIGIADTLNSLFDLSSLEFMGASHTYNYSVRNSRLWVHFPNIMLTDSATNYAASQGWFQFRIKPAGNYPIGTSIPNSAAIYFDYNPPIITNTAIVNYTGPIGITEQQDTQKLSAYPNPASNEITIVSDNRVADGVLNLVSATGQIITAQRFAGTTATIDVSALPAGVYIVLLTEESRNSRMRIVVYR